MSDASAIVATVTGKDLLDKLDALTGSMNEMAKKLDDIPAQVHAQAKQQAAHDREITVIKTQLRAAWAVLALLIAVAGVYASVVHN